MFWNFTINYGSNVTLKMGKLILQRTKTESCRTAMQSIYIGPFCAWAQRFLTKNRLSADGWDHNFCQSRLLPKQGTMTLTPRWGLLFILPENIVLIGTTAEWEGQFWEITSHPLHSLPFHRRCFPSCLVAHVWYTPPTWAASTKSFFHFCSALTPDVFSTTLLPLIKLLGAVIWCFSSLGSVLGLTRKPFSRGLVCFTFLFPHYLYLQLLLLFLS